MPINHYGLKTKLSKQVWVSNNEKDCLVITFYRLTFRFNERGISVWCLRVHSFRQGFATNVGLGGITGPMVFCPQYLFGQYGRKNMGFMQAGLVANFSLYPFCYEYHVYWPPISAVSYAPWDYFVNQGIPSIQII